MKKTLLFLLTLLMLFSLCTASALADSSKVTLIVAGNFGDRSFYDNAKEGLDRLSREKDISPSAIECGNENHDSLLREAAGKTDILDSCRLGFYNIEHIAQEFPDVKFIWIDNRTYEPIANLLNITYAQNEGSFLAGYIAAAVSESGTIGAVGGEDADTINDFITGYRQGAEYYAAESGKTIRVEVNYTNNYDDPAIGRECAAALNDKGADVIFNIASAAGDGIFEAAEEKGFYAIGVDSDQKFIAPDVIICSMKKEIGSSIFEAVSRILDGDDSQLGTTWVADMASGFVSIGYGDPDMPQQVPEDVKEAVTVISQKIVNGEITVNTTR